MWIMLPDAYISAVAYVTNPPQPDKLLVRARVKGDLEKLFPRNVIERTTDADYLYRTVVTRNQLKLALLNEVDRIDYKNFKNAVPKNDNARHHAYLKCWAAMNQLQGQLEPKAAADKWWMRDPDPAMLEPDFDWDGPLSALAQHEYDEARRDADQPVFRLPNVVRGKTPKKSRKVRDLPGKIVGRVA